MYIAKLFLDILGLGGVNLVLVENIFACIGSVLSDLLSTCTKHPMHAAEAGQLTM